MKTTSERWQSWTVVCAMVVCLLSCSGIATPVAEVARPDCGEIVREKPQTFYVSSQGPKGWIKDAQTLEDFRYAATNGFDYVTFEIGARRYPKGWLSSGLAAIAGTGIHGLSCVPGKSVRNGQRQRLTVLRQTVLKTRA